MEWVVEELHVQGPRALVHRECVRGPEVRGMRAGLAASRLPVSGVICQRCMH